MQAFLYNLYVTPSSPCTVYTFGWPSDDGLEKQVYEGQLPTIKKTKESIQKNLPRKGPTMHDTPPKSCD